MKNADAALKLFENEMFLANKAAILVKLNRPNEALPVVNRALQYKNSDSYVEAVNGVVHLALGDVDLAKRISIHALEINENEKLAKETLAEIEKRSKRCRANSAFTPARFDSSSNDTQHLHPGK